MLNVICSFKPDFSIILGDFNARPKPWWQNDIDTNEGTKIDAITSYHGLHQYFPKTLKILCWCPAGSVLPQGRRCFFSLGWRPFQ